MIRLVLAALLMWPTVASAVVDNCIPFTAMTHEEVLASPKRVFAHYMRPFPLSIDNKVSSQDYYTVQFLAQNGEGGKHAAYGGYLRARPLPVTSPNPALDWKVQNFAQEIRMAIARGINGWSFNIFNTADFAPGGPLDLMLQAAQSVDTRFKILFMPDMYSLAGDTVKVANIVRAWHSHPAVYHHTDGRVALSTFMAERVTPANWATMLNTLQGEGIPVAFMPMFGSLPQSIVDQYAPIIVGMGAFGGTGYPDQGPNNIANGARVHASAAPIFIASVTPQGYRPDGKVYWESKASFGYRNAWDGAHQANADIIHITTWNDYSEATHVAPTISATGVSGNAFYNLTGYYAHRFHTGTFPAITHDVFYWIYRQTRTGAVSPAQPQRAAFLPSPMTLSPSEDMEVLSFLTSPGTVTITMGTKNVGVNIPGGMSSVLTPLKASTPVIKLFRAGLLQIRVKSNPQIYHINSGLPSGIQDLTYWSGSYAKDTCIIPMP